MSSIFNQTISNLDEVENYMMDYSLVQEVVVPEVNEPIKVKQDETTYIESDPFQFITDLNLNSEKITLVYKNEQLYEKSSNEKFQTSRSLVCRI
ncbi:hypothetical protein [Piscibacillus salipiscarius]|uniref:hypothetical protein n=1 Tax=Piscibacillus salipiscarius TaxID=299480 RepID=UPI0006D29063|nr:hypothetical protein [Piscibacillus salipiscarius]